jgi:hypothetical protein
MTDYCKKCSEYHRRAQKAEAEVIKLKKLLDTVKHVDPWASEDRKDEAIQRERMANTIERHK